MAERDYRYRDTIDPREIYDRELHAIELEATELEVARSFRTRNS